MINKHFLKTICKDDKLSIDDIEFIIYNEDIQLNPRQVTKQEKMKKKREALEKEKQAKKEVLCKMKKAKKKELEKEKTEKRRKKLAVKKKLKADKEKLKQVIFGGSKGIIVENNNSIETGFSKPSYILEQPTDHLNTSRPGSPSIKVAASPNPASLITKFARVLTDEWKVEQKAKQEKEALLAAAADSVQVKDVPVAKQPLGGGMTKFTTRILSSISS